MPRRRVVLKMCEDACNRVGRCFEEFGRYLCECKNGFSGPTCSDSVATVSSTPISGESDFDWWWFFFVPIVVLLFCGGAIFWFIVCDRGAETDEKGDVKGCGLFDCAKEDCAP